MFLAIVCVSGRPSRTDVSPNKLHYLKPLLSYNNVSGLRRQDAVILRRLRTGHTRLTHSYHLNRKDPPL